MAKQIRLDIVTPDRLVLSQDVDRCDGRQDRVESARDDGAKQPCTFDKLVSRHRIEATLGRSTP